MKYYINKRTAIHYTLYCETLAVIDSGGLMPYELLIEIKNFKLKTLNHQTITHRHRISQKDLAAETLEVGRGRSLRSNYSSSGEGGSRLNLRVEKTMV